MTQPRAPAADAAAGPAQGIAASEPPFRRATVVGLVLTVVAIVAGAAVGFRHASRLHESDERVAHTHEVLSAIDAVVGALTDAETGQRGYLLTGNPRFLEPYEDARARLSVRITRLASLTADDPAQRARVEALRRDAMEKMATLERTVAVMRSRGLPAALEDFRSSIDKETMDAARGIAGRMRDEALELLRRRAEDAERAYRAGVETRVLATALALALVAVTFGGMQRNLALRNRHALVLADERERLRVILAGIADAVMVTDAAGRITFMNPAAEILTGHPRPSGRPHAEVLPIVREATGEPLESPVERALAERARIFPREHSAVVARDGRRIPIDYSASPIGVGGEVTGVVVVFRDVTERRRQEQERRAVDRRKNEFFATLAHELRNPLAPIGQALAVIERGDESQRKQMTRVLGRQARYMARLVEDLLDVGRIEQGKLELRPERIALASVLERAAEICRPGIAALGQALTVDVPVEPIPLRVDPVRMTQVFANLLTNASRYTPRGGHIRVRAARAGRRAEVRVADDGVGIPPDMLSRIFDMFTQGDLFREHAHGGLGIGLTLARRLVEMHAGTIRAESEGPGRGSEFTVVLPLAPEEAPEEPAVPAPDPGASAPRGAPPGLRRVLVVDDNEDAAAALAALLEIDGYETRTAGDGLAAFEAARSFRPDAAILDIDLPGMNGYDVASRIRREEWGAAVLLIALSGWGQDVDRKRSLAAGFDVHFVKPLEPAKIEEFLAGSA